LSVHELRDALTNYWRSTDADQCLTFYDEHVKCQRRVSLQLLNDEKWLAVSQVGIYKGFWCSTCALMKTSEYGGGKGANYNGKGGGQKLGKLVIEPLTNFKKLFGKDGYITNHKTMQYHLRNMQRSQDFLVRTSTISEQNDVLSLINHRHKEESQRNASALESIISILHLCACHIFCGIHQT
jgi:hypothetical protein